jgi:hypothetical protein
MYKASLVLTKKQASKFDIEPEILYLRPSSGRTALSARIFARNDWNLESSIFVIASAFRLMFSKKTL